MSPRQYFFSVFANSEAANECGYRDHSPLGLRQGFHWSKRWANPITFDASRLGETNSAAGIILTVPVAVSCTHKELPSCIIVNRPGVTDKTVVRVWPINSSDKAPSKKPSASVGNLVFMFPLVVAPARKRKARPSAPSQRHREAPYQECTKPRPVGADSEQALMKIRGFLTGS
jgi:hypothetical protein